MEEHTLPEAEALEEAAGCRCHAGKGADAADAQDEEGSVGVAHDDLSSDAP
jgi:hypothetical protein